MDVWYQWLGFWEMWASYVKFVVHNAIQFYCLKNVLLIYLFIYCICQWGCPASSRTNYSFKQVKSLLLHALGESSYCLGKCPRERARVQNPYIELFFKMFEINLVLMFYCIALMYSPWTDKTSWNLHLSCIIHIGLVIFNTKNWGPIW